MARIDAHVHLIPDAYREQLGRLSPTPYPLPPWSSDLLDEFMDRHEIDGAVLSLTPPGVTVGDREHAAQLARLANDLTAEQVAADPGRFAGLASIPLRHMDDALRELSHALDDLQLDGVMLLSNVEGTYLGDSAWDPLLDELDARGAYVFLHPDVPPYELPLDYPVWLHEFPFDTTRAIVNLIYSGTLERCPRVRIQVAHLGGAATFLAHRIASLAEREPKLAARAPAGALAYLERLYYDTGLSANAPALTSTLAVTSPRHIVFGTDWPYAALPESGDPAPGFAGIVDSDRESIDGFNIGALVPRLAREPSATQGP
jgi:predicted TIM-barrel fold metal-dependent hydrolase